MTTFLLSLLIFVLLAFHFSRIVKRVVIKPVAQSGLIGPELLATKTRLDVMKEWLRPMMWGVVVGFFLCPVVGLLAGWWE